VDIHQYIQSRAASQLHVDSNDYSVCLNLVVSDTANPKLIADMGMKQ
jgi:hypothetical protein